MLCLPAQQKAREPTQFGMKDAFGRPDVQWEEKVSTAFGTLNIFAKIWCQICSDCTPMKSTK